MTAGKDEKEEGTDYSGLASKGETARYDNIDTRSTSSDRYSQNAPEMKKPLPPRYTSPPLFGTQLRFAYETIKRVFNRGA